MCTVVFIPDHNNVFFASLRDEHTKRPLAKTPELFSNDENSFLAPIDAQAGGTWLGVNETGTVIILLNGGFEKHTSKPKYAQSRGLIVKNLLVSHSPVTKWLNINLNEIEPFTLVIWKEGKLYQLVWDGEHKHNHELDHTMPHIWSSATLYDKAAKTHREKLFTQWIEKKPVIDPKTLLSFFVSEADTQNGFIINRSEQIKTQNYSFISIVKSEAGYLFFDDFITNAQSWKEIKFKK